MTLNVGVVGVGKIGQEHIRRLTETLAGARVVAVSDADSALAKDVAARLPGATVYATGEELIAAKEVDAVIVTSWGDTHAAYVIAAIRAGKPVFCEKPMATTEADCSAILDAEAAFGRRLVQIGFMRRFDTQYRAMKETVQKGAIGAPLMFHSVHRNASSPGHFKATMAITDTAVHDIDIARFVLDDEPVAIAVKAPRGNSRAGGVADPLFTLMDMRSGALVTIETSVHIAYGYDIRGEVIGETGTVSLAETSDVIVKSKGAYSGHVLRRLAGTVRAGLRRRVPRLDRRRRPGRRRGSERLGRLCRHRRHACRRPSARKRRGANRSSCAKSRRYTGDATRAATAGSRKRSPARLVARTPRAIEAIALQFHDARHATKALDLTRNYRRLGKLRRCPSPCRLPAP